MCNCGGFWTISISDIISIIALFIAAFAAWKAADSTAQAKKANENAQMQFEENMQEQEKAINISLLDKRLEMLEYFENDGKTKSDAWDRLSEKTDFTVERFRLLFSAEIVSRYDEIEALCKEKNDLYYKREQDKAEAFAVKPGERQDIAHDKEEFSRDFLKLENLIVNDNANEQQTEKFKTLCSCSLSPDIHYYDSILRSKEIDKIIEEKMPKLLKAMRDEIKASISDKREKK